MEDNAIVEKTKVVEEKQPKSAKEKTIFGLKIAGNIVFYAIILALLLFSIMNINAGSKNGGFPNIFGKGFLSVQSNSMSANANALPSEYSGYSVGQFEKGDLLYATVFNEKNVNSLKVGDVITFFDKDINELNSHRIVYMTFKDDGTINSFSVQGDYSVTLYGIYNPADSTKASINQEMYSKGLIKIFDSSNYGDIKGVVTGVNHGAGNTVDNLKKNWGWFFVLPIAIVLLVELFFVIKNIIALTSEKQRVALAGDKEKMMADLEAQKEAMRAQILAELKAQENANNKETTDKVEESDKKEE